MPIAPPQLDSRTYDDLVREARERIPRFTPEWTNLNDSDPGMTLVQLQAWLTETVLFELNRLPDAAYVKFLNLLHVEPRPARAARTELAFRLRNLKAPTDPLTVAIPKGAAIDVDDPDLPTSVTFETDRALVALNAAVGAVIAPRAGTYPLELVTRYDDATGTPTFLHSFRAFGDASAGKALLIGLALRPRLDAKLPLDAYSQDVLPTIEIDLHVDMAAPGEPDAAGAPVAAPLALACLGDQAATEASALVRWQIFSGAAADLAAFADAGADDDWTDLPVRGDDTAGLARTGHLRLQLPERATRVSPEALPAELFEMLGLIKPPTSLAELKALLGSGDVDLAAGLDEDAWKAMHLPEAYLNPVVNACTEDDQILAALNALPADVQAALDPKALTAVRWTMIDPTIAAIATPRHPEGGPARPLYWLRAVASGAGAGSGLINAIRLNTVPATAAVTRQSERLGFSTGQPGQRFTLSRTPVLIEDGAPSLELQVQEESGSRVWTLVEDFYAQGADAEVYTLDPADGTVTFGDGRRGRIPVARAAIVATRYRTGGGAIGNVGPGTITKIKGAIDKVEGVGNPRAAAGGDDAEPLADTLLRAPHDLRMRDRAVTAEDFSQLATQVPGVPVSRAFALGNRKPRPGQPGHFREQHGAVSVVILPVSKDAAPTPSEAQLRAVCDFLDDRRLVTTELHITGPRYITVRRLAATLTVARDADLGTVGTAASDALLTFLHPLRGGRDGRGWPFGGPIDFADLYDRLLAVPQVVRVSGLAATLDGGDGDPVSDVLGLPEGALPWLRPERIDLKVVYGNA